jgi:lysophospholipase L1-like esterase
LSDKGTTAFVGDSLTEGGHWHDWFPDHNALNFGVGGDTTDDLLERLSTIVDANPSTVVIMIGTNDLAWRRTVEHVVRNIETTLFQLRRDLPGVRLLVQSVLPRAREFADQIQDINRHVRQFAPSVRALYVDLWPAFARADGEIDPRHSDDRLHLNASGYEAWRAELSAALEVLFRMPSSTKPLPIAYDEYARPAQDPRT